MIFHAGGDDREDRFDATEKISRHPVGAAEVDFNVSAIFEAEDPAVFEEPAHNTPDLDILAHARDADPHGTHAADHEADRNTSCRGAVERLDDTLFYEGIDLGVDPAGSPGLGVLDLRFDQALEGCKKIPWCHQQFFEIRKFRDPREAVKRLG